MHPTPPSGRWLAYLRICLPVALIVLGVSGCREGRLDDATAVHLNNPELRHPISYSKRREQLFVEMPHRGSGLSSDQHADVYRFIERYKEQSNGRLFVSSPASAAGHLSASRTVRQVLSLTRDAGIPDEAIKISRHYNEKGDIGPAIGLSYAKTVAVAPHCGNWPRDIGNRNHERIPFENFGCATQRNLAMTVANGRDLQFPQDETSRSAERRSKNWGDYIGDPQGASKPGTGSGTAIQGDKNSTTQNK